MQVGQTVLHIVYIYVFSAFGVIHPVPAKLGIAHEVDFLSQSLWVGGALLDDSPSSLIKR